MEAPCALFCAILSFIGILFTSFIGMLVQLQPRFMVGIKDDREAKIGCFGGAGLYAVSFLISFFILRRNRKKRAEKLRNYELIRSSQEFYELDGTLTYENSPLVAKQTVVYTESGK